MDEIFEFLAQAMTVSQVQRGYNVKSFFFSIQDTSCKLEESFESSIQDGIKCHENSDGTLMEPTEVVNSKGEKVHKFYDLIKVPLYVQVLMFTVLSKCKTWSSFLSIKPNSNKLSGDEFLKSWYKGFYSYHSKYISSLIDPFILTQKEILKLHEKLAKQAVKMSTPDYVLFSLLCSLLPEWSDIHLKSPGDLGPVDSESEFKTLDI